MRKAKDSHTNNYCHSLVMEGYTLVGMEAEAKAH